MRRRHLRLIFAMALAIGVVLPAAQPVFAAISYSADASGSQVIPGPGDPDALAAVHLTLAPLDGSACVALQLNGFDTDTDPITSITIRSGGAGQVGSVVLVLVIPDPPDDNGICTFDLDPSAVSLVAGNPAGHYVQIDTGAFPNGAARAQLRKVETVSVAVAKVVCPKSVHIPKGPDVSVLFQECHGVGRPGDFGALPSGFAWRISPIEFDLQLTVTIGDGSTLTIDDGSALNFSACDTVAMVCDAAVLYEWQDVPAGTLTVVEQTLPAGAKFVSAIAVDGSNHVRSDKTKKQDREVRVQTSGADDSITIFLIDRE
jgi:hypothetical protein